MKVQIVLDDMLVERLDDCADRNYLKRSQLISIALVQYLCSNSKGDFLKGVENDGHDNTSSEKRS